MYELGLRHTTGKLTIQMGEHTRLPFDVSSIRTIVFRRSEAGLIEARKRLAQAIGAGLEHGGDPVSATRVWFEQTILSSSALAIQEGFLPEEDELGFLEKLANMLEGMESATQVAKTVAAVTIEIGEMANEVAEQTERVNQLGGAPGAKVEIANRLARKLDDPTTRLEVLVGEYSQSIERIHPGTVYLLKLIRDDPQARQEAGEFPRQIGSLIEAVEVTTPKLEGFRNSLLSSGEATRDLRKANRRIAAALELMLSANARMQEWKNLLGPEDLP